MTEPAVSEELLTYLADTDRRHAETVRSRLEAFTPRERQLVREAAVMGYVRGSGAGEEAVKAGERRTRIPPDSDIVFEVVDSCLSADRLYPLIAGSVRHLIRRMVRAHQPIGKADLASAVAVLAAVDEEEAAIAVNDLIYDDELLAEREDGKVVER